MGNPQLKKAAAECFQVQVESLGPGADFEGLKQSVNVCQITRGTGAEHAQNKPLFQAVSRLVTGAVPAHTGVGTQSLAAHLGRGPADPGQPPPLSRKDALMNVTISGHHLEVTPALREYVLTKLERVTRHFDQVVDVNVLLTVENLKEKERRQKAEVTVHVKGRDIFVEQSHEDLYAAIDQLMDKLDRQVVRYKDRIQDHHHATAKRADVSAV